MNNLRWRDYNRRFQKLLLKQGRMELVEVEEDGWWKFTGGVRGSWESASCPEMFPVSSAALLSPLELSISHACRFSSFFSPHTPLHPLLSSILVFHCSSFQTPSGVGGGLREAKKSWMTWQWLWHYSHVFVAADLRHKKVCFSAKNLWTDLD